MVVPHPIFVSSDRSGGLDAPNQLLLHEDAQRVVDRLTGDRADAGPDVLGELFSRGVGESRYGTQDGQALRCDLDPVPA